MVNPLDLQSPTRAHAEDEPDPDQLDGGLDDPEQLDVDELEDDDGWGEDEEE